MGYFDEVEEISLKDEDEEKDEDKEISLEPKEEDQPKRIISLPKSVEKKEGLYTWIDAMIEREALPPEAREETVEEFCRKWNVPRSTYYYQASKSENKDRIVKLSLNYAKKYASEILDSLGKRAIEDNKATELYLKFILQLAERVENKADFQPLILKILKEDGKRD